MYNIQKFFIYINFIKYIYNIIYKNFNIDRKNHLLKSIFKERSIHINHLIIK